MNNHIILSIQYRLFDSDEWHYLLLTPEEYFDLDANELPSVESVPLYNHIVEYVNVEAREIQNTRIVVEDTLASKKYSISETFWNNGRNRIIERIDQDLLSSVHPSEWEIIIESFIDFVDCESPRSEILRISHKDGVISPTFHGHYKKNQDGSETETIVYVEQKSK